MVRKKYNLFKNSVRNIFCWAFGHKVTWYESGYEVCDRCGKHGYHSEDYHKAGLLRLDWWLKIKLDSYKQRFKRKFQKWAKLDDDVPF
jgi:hypothetical protein